jgi:Transposase
MLGVLTTFHGEGGPTMQAEYDGRQIVGIDLHRRRSVIVRMAGSGERLGSARIDNDPMALVAEIAKAGEHPQVVLEATYGWYWAVDVLRDAGAEVHLAHPLGVKGFAYRRVKNDLLTELRRGSSSSGRQVLIGASRFSGRGRRRGRGAGSVPVGGCSAWVVGAHRGSVRAVSAR